MERRPAYEHLEYFDANIVCFVNPSMMEKVDTGAAWYAEGKVLVSQRRSAIVLENGWKVCYDVILKKRQNVRNTAAGLKQFERHARSIEGARAVNFYNPKRKLGEDFCYRESL